MTLEGNSISWEVPNSAFGTYQITIRATNSAGSADITNYVYVQSYHRTEGLNSSLDFTVNGRIGNYGQASRGHFWKEKNGLYVGSFSLVDRNNSKFAGALFATNSQNFRPTEDFTTVSSQFEGFSARQSKFDDAWESSRINVDVQQTIHEKSDGNGRYTIVEYKVVNKSGSTIDDLFTQFTGDYDFPSAGAGTYDASRKLTYQHEVSGANNSNYYGFTVLNRDVSGQAVFLITADNTYIRNTTNLTTSFTETGSGDVRNQLSSGPFSIAADETLTVAYAFVAGDNLAEIQEYTEMAQNRYNGTTPNNSKSLKTLSGHSRARTLDASNYSGSANPSAYAITGDSITVEAWVYLMHLPAQNSEYQIIARPAISSLGIDPYFAYALRVINNDGSARFNFHLSTGDEGSTFGVIADTVTIQVGRWYHLSGTYDGIGSRLFIDGELKVAEEQPGYSIGAGSIGLYIGATTYGGFKGLIDDVRLWNVARTESQISNTMNQPLLGDEDGLAGYWDMEYNYVGSGSANGLTLLPDLTININDLIIQNDAALIDFPFSSEVEIEATDISFQKQFHYSGGNYVSKINSNGWPKPTFTLNIAPEGMTINGDSVYWAVPSDAREKYDVSITAVNSAGSLTEILSVYIDPIITVSNDVSLTVTGRGKIGGFGTLLDKSFYYNGKNGVYSGDFSLVD